MQRFALGNLLSRPVRSALSILGLSVAIGGMVGLFSIAGGISQLVTGTFSLIPGILVQQQGAPVPIFSTLPASWESELAEIEGVKVVNAEIITRINVLEKKPVLSPPRFFVGFDIPSRMQLSNSIYGEKLLSGRFLNVSDQGSMNCLISKQISEETKRTLGDKITANGQTLNVVGIYECGSLLLDCNLLVDIGTLRRLARYDPDSVSCFYIETDPGANQKELGQYIEDQFRGREVRQASGLGSFSGTGSPWGALINALGQSLGATASSPTSSAVTAQSPDSDASNETASDQGTKPSEIPSPVEVRSADDWAERFEDFTGDLKLFLTIMTSVGVVIAVLSIVNTMLMSVMERTIEFGILRANGWTRRNIMSLVTWESASLGILGGLIGSAGGWVVVQILNRIWPERLHLHAGPSLLVFAVVLSTLLGMLGGLYPAWRAAKMSPMDAIRRG